ncbi:MAG: hypothetical protein M1812_005718 [Candelaria pacifica]|nr:MAG: hypothetical protein M1812_005718 [Candelaria pacifica]
MSLIQPNIQNVLSMFTPAQMSAMLGGVPESQSKKKRPVTENVMKKKPRIAVPALPKPNTRPLNSFIAFRSYYSPIFLTIQQKTISGFLTYLWQQDIFQAKWALLAKAYSIVRDAKGKSNTPLDTFLAINGPFIGVICPDDYLALMGWELVLNEQGDLNLTRLFVPDATAFDETLRTTNVSVHDIIQHCYSQGYLQEDDGKLKMIGPMPNDQHLMVSSAQRIAVPTSQQPALSNGSGTIRSTLSDSALLHESANLPASSTQPTPAPITEATTQTGVFDDQTGTTIENAANNLESQTESGEPQGGFSEHDTAVNSTATLAPAVPWWQRTMDEFNATEEQEFPFNNQFNPDAKTSLFFDPFEGDTFNPFDISDFVNDDAFEQ